jgi:hypothetical protein
MIDSKKISGFILCPSLAGTARSNLVIYSLFGVVSSLRRTEEYEVPASLSENAVVRKYIIFFAKVYFFCNITGSAKSA